ncbi:dicarboxylate/amino acid:cation symporter [Clostridium sp. MB40-C1]|uniref:dicarboxylate/amino acid:cation symporter n=1 Tax=Clostridium sp. MB40-C1 TaxID=3070996 RepID=UPI0027DF4584|nr:dicarboxylate/amino acid:cation symporter [Clostridium sp. MB40-C1]WMJ81015.1 dicarboxylate/amino acid:cation symporter [Clostridium sp. MB40-C1]
MKKKNDMGLITKMIIGIVIGILLGLNVSEKPIMVILTIKDILGSIIFFTVPLVIFGFITPAITSLKNNASKMLGAMMGMSYLSAVGAATMSAIAGYIIIPHLNIASEAAKLQKLPKVIFKLDIAPIMPVMTALVLAIFTGIAVIWTKAEIIDKILSEIQDIVLAIVTRIVVPILPVFIAATFSELAYTGSLTKQLPVFLKVIVIVLIGHFIWLTILYSLAGAISKKNPLEVAKHYLPAYLTAVGTMSSAAALPVALKCAHKSKVLVPEVVDFAIPLGATTHLCGSVLTEMFFCMTISKILYGSVPSPGTVALFIVLFGIFAVGAPGVPGGTVMASLAIVTAVLGFDPSGVGLLIAIFALQDSFGTACNITGDAALALMLRGIFYDKDGNPKSNKNKVEQATV